MSGRRIFCPAFPAAPWAERAAVRAEPLSVCQLRAHRRPAEALEAKGWIVRTPDAADVRRVDVVLTEDGAACIRERLGAVLDEVSVLLSALSPEEAAEYVRLQRKLLEKGGTV